jgi:nucleoside 2-deoxyribosyltransferase
VPGMTPNQASVIELADRGAREKPAENLLPPLPVVATARRKRVYLAGFEVFRPDAAAYGESLKALCHAFGFEGIYPLDAAAPDTIDARDRARWIYRANIDAIGRADLVMANVTDFRGPGEPDSGTAFEIGFAVAAGKPVWAYTTDRGELRDRIPSSLTDNGRLCEKGFLVEDFGLPKNLMIACSTRMVHGGAQACLAEMAAAYLSETTPPLYRQDGES